jgi:carboxypeptidase C (cathepsin A)
MPITSIKIILDFEATMRRVDWRWAVAKGYLNKETNQWNEAMGGQAAYLKQRNERMFARFVSVGHIFEHEIELGTIMAQFAERVDISCARLIRT